MPSTYTSKFKFRHILHVDRDRTVWPSRYPNRRLTMAYTDAPLITEVYLGRAIDSVQVTVIRVRV